LTIEKRPPLYRQNGNTAETIRDMGNLREINKYDDCQITDRYWKVQQFLLA